MTQTEGAKGRTFSISPSYHRKPAEYWAQERRPTRWSTAPSLHFRGARRCISTTSFITIPSTLARLVYRLAPELRIRNLLHERWFWWVSFLMIYQHPWSACIVLVTALAINVYSGHRMAIQPLMKESEPRNQWTIWTMWWKTIPINHFGWKHNQTWSWTVIDQQYSEWSVRTNLEWLLNPFQGHIFLAEESQCHEEAHEPKGSQDCLLFLMIACILISACLCNE